MPAVRTITACISISNAPPYGLDETRLSAAVACAAHGISVLEQALTAGMA